MEAVVFSPHGETQMGIVDTVFPGDNGYEVAILNDGELGAGQRGE